MNPDRQRLQSALAELEQQLAALENVDASVREKLHTTIAEIETLLDESNSSAGDEHGAPLTERLTDAVEHFEESHPTFAGLLGSVIDTLGRMGI